MLEKGSLLNNKYKILKNIGKGAMGNVYLAKRFYSSEKIVIKEILINQEVGLDYESSRDLFLKEAEFLKKFDHPGIPRFYEVFSNNEKCYISMNYIEGDNLEQFLKNPGCPIQEIKAIHWTIELCDILDYLHNSFHLPLVYKDLKPSNIMITLEGEAKLIDFGISRYYNPDKNTDTFRLGSPGYAAPEQYKGKGQTSPQTDVFALGVILFQMLTGYDPTVTPFKFPPINSLNSSISKELENIVMRAIELKPLDRYISVLEFKDKLQKFLASRKKPLSIVSSKENEEIFNSKENEKYEKLKKEVEFLLPRKSQLKRDNLLIKMGCFSFSIHAVIIFCVMPMLVIIAGFLPEWINAYFCPICAIIFFLNGIIALIRLGLKDKETQYSFQPDKNEFSDSVFSKISKERVEIGKYLFDDIPSLANFKQEGLSFLNWAFLNEKVELVELLISKGADVNLIDPVKNTPLHNAVKSGNKKIVQLLLLGGAYTYAQDTAGNTPLDVADRFKQKEISSLIRSCMKMATSCKFHL